MQERRETVRGSGPEYGRKRGTGVALAALVLAGAMGTWGGQAMARGGDSYKIQLVNKTCAELTLTWEDGLACDSPGAPGCSIALGSQISTNLSLNLERPASELKLTATGTCAGGDAAAHVRVAGDDAPGQVARALRAATEPMRIEGTCLLPLTRMFPYAGLDIRETRPLGPAPIVQPAPGGGFAYRGPDTGDPFGPMGPWGEPRTGITTTVPEITSPIPVLLENGPCRPGPDGIQVCGLVCSPQEAEGGLPDILPGQIDNTD